MIRRAPSVASDVKFYDRGAWPFEQAVARLGARRIVEEESKIFEVDRERQRCDQFGCNRHQTNLRHKRPSRSLKQNAS